MYVMEQRPPRSWRPRPPRTSPFPTYDVKIIAGRRVVIFHDRNKEQEKQENARKCKRKIRKKYAEKNKKNKKKQEQPGKTRKNQETPGETKENHTKKQTKNQQGGAELCQAQFKFV